jgi:hypothetical protein
LIIGNTYKINTRKEENMGSTDFVDEGRGSNASVVFKELVRDAKSYYGNSPYGGHIGLKDGFVMHTKEVVTQRQAHNMANEAMSRPPYKYGKWDYAGAIAYGEEKVVASKEFEVTVKARDRGEATDLILAKMRGGRKRQGTTVEVKINSIKKTAEAGKRNLTRTKSKGSFYYTFPNGEKYPTLKEATEALSVYLSNPNSRNTVPGKEYNIKKVQEFGSISYQESSKLPTYTVKGVRNQVKVGGVKGYLFFGSAPS